MSDNSFESTDDLSPTTDIRELQPSQQLAVLSGISPRWLHDEISRRSRNIAIAFVVVATVGILVAAISAKWALVNALVLYIKLTGGEWP